MKKKNTILASLLAISMIFTGCSSKEGFPENPEDGQSFTTSNGSTGTWNAIMGYWMISSMINGQRVQNRYYPSTGTYTNNAGTPIKDPKYFSKSNTNSSTKKGGFGSSTHRTVVS